MKVELDVKIPTSMSAINLYQYQKYIDITKDIDVKEVEAIKFANLKALEIFCDLKLKETYKLPVSTFDAVLKQIDNCLVEETP